MTNPSASHPDLLAHTGARAAELAADAARGLVARRLRSLAKGYLPRVLWPLIPGVGGSVGANLKASASRWVWGLVTSAIVSLLFVAAFASIGVGVLGVTVFAFVAS